MDEKKFPHFLVYTGLVLIIASLVGAIVVGKADGDRALTTARDSLATSEAINDRLRTSDNDLRATIERGDAERRAESEARRATYQRITEEAERAAESIQSAESGIQQAIELNRAIRNILESLPD